jgi:hypothetical protein
MLMAMTLNLLQIWSPMCNSRPIGDHYHDKKPNEPAARRAGAVPAVVTLSGGSGLFDFEKSASRSDSSQLSFSQHVAMIK